MYDARISTGGRDTTAPNTANRAHGYKGTRHNVRNRSKEGALYGHAFVWVLEGNDQCLGYHTMW